MKDGDGKLWCFFDHHWTSNNFRHYIRVKSSSDDGQTWGSGISDLGTALSSAWVEQGYVAACRHLSTLYAVYCAGRSYLNLRTCDLANSTWSAESAIASLDHIDDQFHAAFSADGKLGVVFVPSESGKVYLKEFDGLIWSGLIEVENTEARSPQIIYKDSIPRIIYACHLGNSYYAPRLAKSTGGAFAQSNLSGALGTFEKVLLYSAGAVQQYQDKTAAAASVTAGDIFHSESQGLLDSVGDRLYLGMQVKFYCAAVILSTPGTGGSIVWEYFNGTGWVEFTPYSGAFNFDSADQLIYLWQDSVSAPSDWQIGTVNNDSAFWARARVTGGFSQNPVGTQIVAATQVDDFSLAQEAA